MGAIVSEQQRKQQRISKKKPKDSGPRISTSPEESKEPLSPDPPSSFLDKFQKSCYMRESSPSIDTAALCLNSGSEIIDGLYIGGVQVAARVLSTDDHMGFSHILSLSSTAILSSFCRATSTPETIFPFRRSERPIFAQFEEANRGPRLVRLVIPLNDTPEQGILHVLKPCFEFIDEGIRQGTVLVHCMAGVSRSAAIVTAYLMRTLKLPLKEALKLLRKNHKRASPNIGFLQQLQWIENICLREDLKAGQVPSSLEERLKITMLASGQSRIENGRERC